MNYEEFDGQEPTLVTLEGEYDSLSEILTEDDLDYIIENRNSMDEDDINYYADEYPELLGIAPTVIKKVGGGIARIVKRIARRIKNKRAKRRRRKKNRNKQLVQSQPMRYAPQPVGPAKSGTNVLMVVVAMGGGLFIINELTKKKAGKR